MAAPHSHQRLRAVFGIKSVYRACVHAVHCVVVPRTSLGILGFIPAVSHLFIVVTMAPVGLYPPVVGSSQHTSPPLTSSFCFSPPHLVNACPFIPLDGTGQLDRWVPQWWWMRNGIQNWLYRILIEGEFSGEWNHSPLSHSLSVHSDHVISSCVMAKVGFYREKAHNHLIIIKVGNKFGFVAGCY